MFVNQINNFCNILQLFSFYVNNNKNNNFIIACNTMDVCKKSGNRGKLVEFVIIYTYIYIYIYIYIYN